MNRPHDFNGTVALRCESDGIEASGGARREIGEIGLAGDADQAEAAGAAAYPAEFCTPTLGAQSRFDKRYGDAAYRILRCTGL
jgi:hypothetical protein